MKNPSRFLKKRLLGPSRILAMMSCLFLSATEGRTAVWSGAGGDADWQTDLNWEEGVAPDDGATLIFTGNTRTGNHNNFADNTLFEIRFAEGAGSFELTGNQVRLNGNIVNASLAHQTIDLDLNLWDTSRTIDSGPGNLTISGSIVHNGGTPTLTKTGSGRLILSGANSYTGATIVNEGVLELDLGTGSIHSGGALTLGGGEFYLKGADTGTSSQTLGSLTLVDNSGANRITVDSNSADGTLLTLGNTWTRGANNDASLHIDLSAPNAALASSPGTSNGIIRYATVYKGGKTGFATVVGGQIDRLAPTVDLPTTGGSASDNFRLAGNHAITSATAANSITITESGTLTGFFRLSTSYVLMDEGVVGDYTIHGSALGTTATTGEVIIHQYSTQGNLIVYRITAGSLTKTGPGTLILTGGGASGIPGQDNPSNYAGATNIHGGMLVVNGGLSATSAVTVHREAVLSGNGSIGTSTTNTLVRSGGTLRGATSADAKALTFLGGITLQDSARFEMTLDGVQTTGGGVVVGGPISLDGADLALDLTYAVVPGTTFMLINNLGTGAIDGVFASINGVAFDSGTPFTLNYDGQDYFFQLSYLGGTGNDLILTSLTAIPEPGSVLLIVGMGLMFLIANVRRRLHPKKA